MNNSKNGNRYCVTCGCKLQKNGIECGRQRWRCPICKTARILTRPDVKLRRRAITTKKYLLQTESLKTVAKLKRISTRTLQRRNSSVLINTDLIKPTITGEVYPYLVIDAKNINGYIVTIVRDEHYVRNFEFAVYECSAVWETTLRVLPKPEGIVSDGQKGILKALNNLWGKGIVIQRCHFHVAQNIRAKLTLHPESEAGQDLQRLVSFLRTVRTYNQMSQFIAIFYGLCDVYEAFLNERTYSYNPNSKRKWFYTHRRVRSAYRQIADLIEQDQLFAYITHPRLNLPRTTNYVEGGINSRLSELLRAHRGMSINSQMRAIAEYLNSRAEG
jgi:transposase-like protein